MEKAYNFQQDGFAYMSAIKLLELNDSGWRKPLEFARNDIGNNQNESSQRNLSSLLDFIEPGLEGDALILELYNRAYECFKKGGMRRLCWYVVSETAKVYERLKKYTEAYRLVVQACSVYRREQWWLLLQNSLDQALGCAIALNDELGGKRALSELISGPFTVSPHARRQYLSSKLLSNSPPVVYRLYQPNGIFHRVHACFSHPEALLGSSVRMQLQLEWKEQVELDVRVVVLQLSPLVQPSLSGEQPLELIVCFAVSGLIPKTPASTKALKFVSSSVTNAVLGSTDEALQRQAASSLPFLRHTSLHNKVVFAGDLPSTTCLFGGSKDLSMKSTSVLEWPMPLPFLGKYRPTQLLLGVGGNQSLLSPVILLQSHITLDRAASLEWWTGTDQGVLRNFRPRKLNLSGDVAVEHGPLPVEVVLCAPEHLFYDEAAVIRVECHNKHDKLVRLVRKSYSVSSGVVCPLSAYSDDLIHSKAFLKEYKASAEEVWEPNTHVSEEMCVFHPSPEFGVANLGKVQVTVQFEFVWGDRVYQKLVKATLNTAHAFESRAELVDTFYSNSSNAKANTKLIHATLCCNPYVSVELIDASINLDDSKAGSDHSWVTPCGENYSALNTFTKKTCLQPRQEFHVYALVSLCTKADANSDAGELFSTIDLGFLNIRWKRGDNMPVSFSRIKLPVHEAQSHERITLSINCSSVAVAYQPFQCAFKFCNNTSQFVSGLQVTIEPSDGMTFAGYRSFELVMLPQQVVEFKICCIATIPGETTLPIVKIVSTDSSISSLSNASTSASRRTSSSSLASASNTASTSKLASPVAPFSFSTENGTGAQQQKLSIFVYPLADLTLPLPEDDSIKPAICEKYAFLLS